MMRVIQSWWNFSECWGGVGAPLFWWTVLSALLFAAAAVSFLRRCPPGRRTFLVCLIAVVSVHAFVILLTWSRVWATLYITSYHWAAGEREENAFLMWQATVGLGILSSCLLGGAAIMIKPEGAANNTPEDIRR